MRYILFLLILTASAARAEDWSVCPDDWLFFGISREQSERGWKQALDRKEKVQALRAFCYASGLSEEWERMYADAWFRWACWDAIDDGVRCAGPEMRRAGMQRLLRLLGEEHYYRGILPAP
jgi:hypothetical protein